MNWLSSLIGYAAISAFYINAIKAPWFQIQFRAISRHLDTDAEFWLVWFGTFLLNFSIHWTLCAAFYLIDMYLYNNNHKKANGDREWSWMGMRKLQPTKRPQWADYIKASKVTVFNQLCLNLPGGYVLATMWTSTSKPLLALPTAWTMVRDLAIFAAVEEVGFYTFHRMFHHPRIYKYVHKLHHEFTAPMALASIYAHPLEHIVANLFPLTSGPLLVRAFFPNQPGAGHLLTFWLWTILATLNVIITHSGYMIPFFPDSTHHDFHHMRFNENFGVFGLLDYLFGTDKNYRLSLKSMIPVSMSMSDTRKAAKVQ